VSWSACGFTTASGRSSRCAFWCKRIQAGFILLGLQAVERALDALQAMDGLGLRAPLVHAQHNAAVQQLFVDLDGRRRQEDHHRTFHAVLLRHEVAGVGVLAGARNGQLAFALQELQGVARAARALFLGDGEDLVFQIGLAHVEQALPGHRAVLDALFLGHEGEHRIHQ